MPNKKRKFSARFPPARIKKIMQTDEDVGKVAVAVPVIISKALEMFIESLILKSADTTKSRNAKTLSSSHIKQVIMSEKKFDFLKDLVSSIPDVQGEEESGEPSTAPARPAKRHPAEPKPATVSAPGKRPRGRPKKVKPSEELAPPKPEKRKKKEESSEEEDEDMETDSAGGDDDSDDDDDSAIHEHAQTSAATILPHLPAPSHAASSEQPGTSGSHPEPAHAQNYRAAEGGVEPPQSERLAQFMLKQTGMPIPGPLKQTGMPIPGPQRGESVLIPQTQSEAGQFEVNSLDKTAVVSGDSNVDFDTKLKRDEDNSKAEMKTDNKPVGSINMPPFQKSQGNEELPSQFQVAKSEIKTDDAMPSLMFNPRIKNEAKFEKSDTRDTTVTETTYKAPVSSLPTKSEDPKSSFGYPYQIESNISKGLSDDPTALSVKEKLSYKLKHGFIPNPVSPSSIPPLNKLSPSVQSDNETKAPKLAVPDVVPSVARSLPTADSMATRLPAPPALIPSSSGDVRADKPGDPHITDPPPPQMPKSLPTDLYKPRAGGQFTPPPPLVAHGRLPVSEAHQTGAVPPPQYQIPDREGSPIKPHRPSPDVHSAVTRPPHNEVPAQQGHQPQMPTREGSPRKQAARSSPSEHVNVRNSEEQLKERDRAYQQLMYEQYHRLVSQQYQQSAGAPLPPSSKQNNVPSSTHGTTAPSQHSPFQQTIARPPSPHSHRSRSPSQQLPRSPPTQRSRSPPSQRNVMSGRSPHDATPAQRPTHHALSPTERQRPEYAAPQQRRENGATSNPITPPQFPDPRMYEMYKNFSEHMSPMERQMMMGNAKHPMSERGSVPPQTTPPHTAHKEAPVTTRHPLYSQHTDLPRPGHNQVPQRHPVYETKPAPYRHPFLPQTSPPGPREHQPHVPRHPAQPAMQAPERPAAHTNQQRTPPPAQSSARDSTRDFQNVHKQSEHETALDLSSVKQKPRTEPKDSRDALHLPQEFAQKSVMNKMDTPLVPTKPVERKENYEKEARREPGEVSRGAPYTGLPPGVTSVTQAQQMAALAAAPGVTSVTQAQQMAALAAAGQMQLQASLASYPPHMLAAAAAGFPGMPGYPAMPVPGFPVMPPMPHPLGAMMPGAFGSAAGYWPYPGMPMPPAQPPANGALSRPAAHDKK